MRPEDRKAILQLPDDDCRTSETAVVMVSCSAYSQVWMPFFTLFRRYWPDCPYPVYFLTDVEHHGIPDAPWMTDCIGTYAAGKSPIFAYTEPDDLGWCANFVRLMRFVREKHIIMFQEDFLLRAPVDTPVVRRLARYARENDIGCLRLMPCPGPDREWRRGAFLGEIAADANYRVSFQLAIWNRELIIDCAARAGSPWLMEQRGSELTRAQEKPFLSVHRESYDVPGSPVPYFITAITRGKWEKGALELLRREKISMDGITERIP